MPSSIEDINIQLARYHLNTDILQFALPNQQTFESLLHRISENPPNVLLLISQALINQHCQQSYISQEIINLHTNLPEEVFNDITYCLLRLATNNMMNISNAFSLLHAHQEISFIRIVMDVLLQDGLLAIDNFIQLCAIARSDNKKYYISILHILGQRNMLTDVIYRAIVPVMIRSEKTARGFYFIVQKLHSDNNLTDSNMNFFSKLCSESTILSELFDSYDHIETHQINTILLMIRSEHLFSGLSVDSLKKIITMTENTPAHL